VLKCGSGYIERFEIEARCPEVAQFIQSSVMQEQAAIGRDVVRDELPKEGPPGRDGRIVSRPPEPSGPAAASMAEPDFPSANNMIWYHRSHCSSFQRAKQLIARDAAP